MNTQCVMRSMRWVRPGLLLGGLLLATLAVGSLSLPTTAAGYSVIGGELGVGTTGNGYQRDVRVWNNSTDATANDNTIPEASHPGALGAALAIWKATQAWNSNTPGAGSNFDWDWQGTSFSSDVNQNTVSWGGGCSGGLLAYLEAPIADGWRIHYCDNWFWGDGPGVPTGTIIDIQGVGAHELGHALGLGHTDANCGLCTDGAAGHCTMCPFMCFDGVAERSIQLDDSQGLASIYGLPPLNKPVITNVIGNVAVGGAITIVGHDFAPFVNVKFTAHTSTNTPPIPGVIENLPSSAGGTQVSLTIPLIGVDRGNILVWEPDLGLLSNAFPIDIAGVPMDPPTILNIAPASGPAAGFTSVGINGSGFVGVTSVTFDGAESPGFTVNSAVKITAFSPPGTANSLADVKVTDADGAGQLLNGFTYTTNPPPDIAAVVPSTGNASGATPVQVIGTYLANATSVTFGGAPGFSLQITSPTTLTMLTPPHAPGLVDVKIFDAVGNFDTQVNGFFYTGVNQGNFFDIGPGLFGTTGVPVLAGSGDLTELSPTGFTLSVSNALPNALAGIFFSVAQGSFNFKGGTFYPLPVLLQLYFFTDPTGQIVLPAQIGPAPPPGLGIVLQTWIQDGGAPQGVSATNGLKMILP